ncbi:MFS transporter [Actinomadura sp. HBU206391]|uniref:MFS transporter n=1 Tax=Actinomadura sp. HBU206391 TaxID=2731692 RepID=UPI0016504F92|nr:MFS transporter [Actinomadura sp. HBU206391]MBC6457410.1 MFS transporter [Actinomadura sp. HBU206391]
MHPLRDRRFRLLWAGQTLSHIGDAVTPVALTLAVVTTTGSATQLGLVLAAQAIAQVALILPGGVWADRLSRRRLMLTADLVRTLTHVLMGAELIGGSVNVTHLAVLAAVSGGASAFFLPASTGLVPATVDPAGLQRANGLMAVAKHGSRLLGPAIATILALTIGPGWAIVLDAATFAVSALTLSRLRVAQPPPRARARFHAQLAEGWAELRRYRWYWTNLIGHCAWNLGRCVFLTVGPLIAINAMGGELAWGTIAQGGPVGALVGALIGLRVRPRRPLLAANLALALGALPFLVLAARAPALLVAVAYGLMAGGLAFMAPLWETVMQRHIPEETISRVSAYDWLVSLALTPVGMAVAGPLAASLGATTVLYGSAALILISCVGVLALPDVRDLRSADGTPEPDSGSAERDVPAAV